MKYLRRSLIAVVLALTLTGSAIAGDIQCGFASTGTTNEVVNPVTEIALNLVQSMLSLF